MPRKRCAVRPEAEKLLSVANAEIVPDVIAGAPPYGVVARATYEKFREEILDGARRAGHLDGIYLDMHGAMHVEGYPDAQADFIRALRRVVGDDVLIAASFDLHGNVSEEFARGLNIATAFRTAPHVDQSETRLRAIRLLLEAIRNHWHPVVVSLRVPMLIPGEKAITAVEPLRSIYAQLPAASKKKGILDASILIGHTFQDVPRVSMRVLVVADGEANRGTAMDEARLLGAQLWEKRAELRFDVPTDTIDGAIDTALKAPEKTVFITDSGDNITAGAAGDTTLALERLQAKHVRDAVLAGIVDPEAVLACEKAGAGHHVRLRVGGKLDTVFSKPYEFDSTVVRITPGGGPDGRTAVVDANGILVALLDRRRAFTSPEQFKEVGIDPLQHKIVIVKEGYLFQALRDIAPRTIMALTPGSANPLREASLYKHLIRPIYPLDPKMTWKP